MDKSIEDIRKQHSEQEFLERTILSLNQDSHEISPSDLIVILLYTLMLESEFSPCETDCGGIHESETLNSGTASNLPNAWKDDQTNVYKITFILNQIAEHRCRLVGFLIGDILELNLIVSNIVPKIVFGLSFRCSDVIKKTQPSTPVLARYANIRQLKEKLKKELLYPVRCIILNEVHVLNGSLLGIPDDLKHKIYSQLKLNDIYSLLMSCRYMNNLIVSDRRLWKKLFCRYYPTAYNELIVDNRENIDWKKELQKRRQQRIASRGPFGFSDFRVLSY
ncbi:F-box only protein 7-like [Schistocerca nitens]|uniref:F-box only protein 7-like n=1 Tax=Schistocerca nitens TaxID=7011 RepID=UPI00211786F9|nr:F-box only protein 7-like [Schistocerca nitens]